MTPKEVYTYNLERLIPVILEEVNTCDTWRGSYSCCNQIGIFDCLNFLSVLLKRLDATLELRVN